MKANDLSISSAGDITIPSEKLGKLKGVEASNLRLVELAGDLMLTMHPQPGQRNQPILYGDLRLFHVAELMALISSMRREGSLHLLVPHARKTIYFAAGEVVYASSNVEDDRLGEALWRHGLISLEQLSKVCDLVGPGKRLGSLLVERGLITPRQLYEGVKHQVLDIVYSTFHMHQGEFLFVEGEPPIKGTIRLDATTREVIMEGVKRVEEMTRLEELFPDPQMIPTSRPVTVDVKMGEAERHMQKLVDGKKSVQDLVTESRLGEYAALRALAHLRRLGLIEFHRRTDWERQEDGPLPKVLEEYRKVLRLIHQTLKAEKPEYVARLEAYLGNPTPKHREVFLRVGFDQDGRIDVETLQRNAKAQRLDNPRGLALEALQGLYNYALFQAMDVLDATASKAMVQRIESIRDHVPPAEQV